MPRKRSPRVVIVAVVVLLCYAAIWLGGKTWAMVWQYYHRFDQFVPASSLHQR